MLNSSKLLEDTMQNLATIGQLITLLMIIFGNCRNGRYGKNVEIVNLTSSRSLSKWVRSFSGSLTSVLEKVKVKLK